MPRILLMYDIAEDRARSKVADLCLDYALQRIQYSAFCGTLSRTLIEELMLKIGRIVHGKEHNVQAIPICASDWDTRRVLASRIPPGTPTDRDEWDAQPGEYDE